MIPPAQILIRVGIIKKSNVGSNYVSDDYFCAATTDISTNNSGLAMDA
jgi:hypothetical protein